MDLVTPKKTCHFEALFLALQDVKMEFS